MILKFLHSIMELFRISIYRTNRKIFISFSTLFIIITILSNISAYYVIKASWTNQSKANISKSSVQILNILDNYVDTIKNLLFSIASNDCVTNLFIENHISEFEEYMVKNDVSKLITSVVSLNSDMRVYFISTRSKWLLSSEPGQTLGSYESWNFEKEKWFAEITSQNGNISLVNNFKMPHDKSTYKGLAMSYRVTYMGNTLGYVLVSSDKSLFNGLFQGISGKSLDLIYILKDKNEVIYSSSLSSSNNVMQVPDELLDTKEPFIHKINGILYFISLIQSDKYNLGMLSLTQQRNLGIGMERLAVAFILINSVLLLFCLLLAYFLANGITRPIKCLMKEVDTIENEDHKIHISVRNIDEVGELAKSINKMIDRINILMKDVIREQVLKKQAEVNALQQQINPHFLYNILETINSIADIHECREICTISQKLGEMFRYSISNSDNSVTSFTDELKHIENYIFIQKIRYDRKFDVEYDLDERLCKCRTIKFLLQPVVENSICHGIEKYKTGGIVKIKGTIEENSTVVIEISDNGTGMDAETLDSINKSLLDDPEYYFTKHKRTKSIGLNNVHWRIVFAYGRQYGLEINSTVNMGTNVLIRIPYICEEERNDT